MPFIWIVSVCTLTESILASGHEVGADGPQPIAPADLELRVGLAGGGIEVDAAADEVEQLRAQLRGRDELVPVGVDERRARPVACGRPAVLGVDRRIRRARLRVERDRAE